MSATELKQLRLQLRQVEAENERLRQERHLAGVDAALATVRSAEAEDRLQVILNSATDYAIFTTDQRGFTTSWNEGAWRLLGWHENEIVGQDIRVIFTPEDQAAGALEQEMQTASNEGRAEDERWHIRKDGSRFWGSGIVMPLRGGSVGFLKILRNNTEKRKNANAVHDTAALKASVLDAALDSIVTITADSTVLEWNPAAERTFGYSAAEALGQDIARLIIPPELRERHHRGMAHYLATGHGPVLGHRIELEAMRAGGSRFPVELAITPITLQGQPHFTAYLRDITHRKHVEAALRESENRLKVLVENLPVGVCFVDHDGKALLSNPAFRRFVPDASMPSRVPDAEERWVAWDENGERLPRHRYPGVRALRGEAVSGIEFLYRPKEGPEIWTRVSGVPFLSPDGSVAAALIVITDIDAQKRAQEALQRLNQDLAGKVAARTAERDRTWLLSQDLFAVAGFDGYLKAINPAWSRMLGFDEAALLSMPFTDLIHPDDLAAASEIVGTMMQGQNIERFEDRLRTRDGSYRTVSWTAVPEAEVFYAVGRDVTAERRAAETLRQTEGALRQSQKMEAVGQLTGGLAHDFNNLLTGITGSLELLQTRMSQGRLTEIDRYVNAAQGAAKRAAALTHRLLAFSRRQTLDPKPTDVNALIRGMEELIRRTVGPEVAVEVVGAAGLWPALIDPPQLENALLNLCINARDAMPDGGRITIETANKWLDDHAARERDLPPGQYLSLCVTDTGTGMTPEVIAKAFEPFYTTKPIGQGTGLGLSMIYGFVLQSGGHVRIYSEVGQGTTMCLYLPRHYGKAEGEIAPPDLADAPRAEQGETVLIVDDEPTVRMLVTEVLEDLNYTAIEAADGPSGLKVLHSNVRIDLLVTDVGLPGGMNGRQMADAARVTRPDLKVLFITGYAENAVLGNGYLEPGMRVMTKPFVMETLASRIREMIAS